jgi:hypothetical protein
VLLVPATQLNLFLSLASLSALYDSAFNVNKAPTTLKEALDRYDIERANTKFGFPKDHQIGLGSGSIAAQHVKPDAQSSTTTSTSSSCPVQPTGWQRNPSCELPPSHKNQDADIDAHGPRHMPAAAIGRGPLSGSTTTIPTSTCQQIPPRNTTQQTHRFVERPSQVPEQSSTSSLPPVTPADGGALIASVYPVRSAAASLAQPTHHRPNLPHPSATIHAHQPQRNSGSGFATAGERTPHSIPSVAVPPPTPTDSLRNSGIFSFLPDEDDTTNAIVLPPPRPTSSYGKPAGRSSLGNEARLIQPPPIVTPSAHGEGADRKRPLQSIDNFETSQTKKVLLPSGTGSSGSHPHCNPYGKVSRPM